MIARYRHLRAACSVREWPRAFTALLSRALIDSIALVVQMTVLISRPKASLEQLQHAVAGTEIVCVQNLFHLADRTAAPLLDVPQPGHPAGAGRTPVAAAAGPQRAAHPGPWLGCPPAGEPGR